MSTGASATRVCSKCGYVFEPFETDCPKCAASAAAHPAVGDLGHAEADRQQRELTYRKRLLRTPLRREVAIISIALVLAAIATLPVAFITVTSGVLGAGDACFRLILGFVVLALLIYTIADRFLPQPTVLYDGPGPHPLQDGGTGRRPLDPKTLVWVTVAAAGLAVAAAPVASIFLQIAVAEAKQRDPMLLSKAWPLVLAAGYALGLSVHRRDKLTLLLPLGLFVLVAMPVGSGLTARDILLAPPLVVASAALSFALHGRVPATICVWIDAALVVILGLLVLRPGHP